MQNSKDFIFSKNSIQLFKKTSNVKAWLRQPHLVLSRFIKTNNKNGLHFTAFWKTVKQY